MQQRGGREMKNGGLDDLMESIRGNASPQGKEAPRGQETPPRSDNSIKQDRKSVV